MRRPIEALSRLIFTHRRLVIVVFLLATALMGYSATKIGIDAGFSKLLPLEHEYMQTFSEYREEFGGANRVLIALMVPEGDIFTPEFFSVLQETTDEVFFLPGVDRTRVKSLFTPNVRFTEVVEDGIAAGNVVPADFEPTPEGLAQVRENVLKADLVGRLVASDFSGALISAQLLEIDPNTGEPLDYIAVARELELKIRAKNDANAGVAVDTHIIGFAKVIGDISDGAMRVLLFFGVSLLITTLFLYAYTQSWRHTLVVLICSVVAVVWQLGALALLGYGVDPMGILVPFLVFAIAVSHGVQMVSATRVELFFGHAPTAARMAFGLLVVPGVIALASDTVGFITILVIKIQVIREMAIAASLGVATIILTNLVLLPVLLTYIDLDEAYRRRLTRRADRLLPLWARLARIARPGPAAAILACATLLLAIGLWRAPDVRIGDLHAGVPELRQDSRYNIDSAVISERFAIGVDLISVIAETIPEGCIDYDMMTGIDEFTWRMRNVEGVRTAISLPVVAKVINSGWNEGALKWRVIPRNQSVLVQSVAYVPTSSGLLNEDCSVMPVLLFTTDHKAETIDRVVAAVKTHAAELGSERLRFRLATGNVGVMAATNEEVAADQFPILLGVFSAVILLCLVTFRSIRAVACIVLPLGLVSLLAYALMAQLEIGLKVSTLPVVALGVGIGVDYGIYFYARFVSRLAEEGNSIEAAYRQSLRMTGTGVIFTGIALAVGVGTWIFAPLKFQADMGVLLTFMFTLNMLGAIVLLPALAAWLMRSKVAAVE